MGEILRLIYCTIKHELIREQALEQQLLPEIINAENEDKAKNTSIYILVIQTA